MFFSCFSFSTSLIKKAALNTRDVDSETDIMAPGIAFLRAIIKVVSIFPSFLCSFSTRIECEQTTPFSTSHIPYSLTVAL